MLRIRSVVLSGSILALMLSAPALVLAQPAADAGDQPSGEYTELREKASAGDTSAAKKLGILLARKDRSAEEHAEAAKLLLQASESGDADASRRLAAMLHYGTDGVPADEAQAATLYQIAVEAGDVKAMKSLASLLSFGKTLSLDPVRAVELLRMAAEAGDSSARVKYAKELISGKTVPVDADQAVALLEPGFEAEDKSAVATLAGLYRKGAGAVPANLELAREYYKLAWELEDAGSGQALGDMMIKGEGGPQDIEAGFALLETIAETDPRAYTQLGDYYRKGEDIAQDDELALDYYRLGSDAGDIGATRKLAEMVAVGNGVDADLDEATSMLEELGDGVSLELLGRLNARDDVTTPDLSVVTDYYEAAAAEGRTSALRRLGDLYSRGLGDSPADPDVAADYYQQAIEAGDLRAARPLAKLLLAQTPDGADRARAAELLQAGLDAGDVNAGIDLGNGYASGSFGPPDLNRARTAFAEVKALGNGSADWRLATAILKGPLASQAGKGAAEDLARLAKDSPDAAYEISRLIVKGAIPGKGPADAVELLNAHVDAAKTLKLLVGLYRDGVKDKLPPRPETAAALLARSESVLSDSQLAYERLLVNARIGERRLYVPIASDLASLDAKSGSSAVSRLRSINQNAYVYALQAWLTETERYSGPLSGTLNQKTISAFNAACSAADRKNDCIKGPLSSDAGRVAGALMFPAD